MSLAGKWSRSIIAVVAAMALTSGVTPAYAAVQGICPEHYQPPLPPAAGTKPERIAFTDPLAQIAFTYRDMMDVDPDFGRDVDPTHQTPGREAFNGSMNVAVGFFDITDCDPAAFDSRFVTSVETLKHTNPALLRQLALPPGTRTILAIPRFNANKTAKGLFGTVIEHSEPRVVKGGRARELPVERLLVLYTDLAPCSPSSANCRALVAGTNARVVHSADSQGQLWTALKEALGNTIKADAFALDLDALAADPAEGRRSIPTIFRPRPDMVAAPAPVPASNAPPSPAPPSSAPSSDGTLAGALKGDDLGGVDFSALELRYFADAGTDDPAGIRYGFTPGATGAKQATGERAAGAAAGFRVTRQASDAFFVWLALPAHKFTVNLNPSEPDRIIDADFGTTDAGRILLEADLHMKKTVAKLIHPDTALGRRFWEGTRGKCLVFRQWIVPAPASVHERGDELYILDAPLEVKLENEYLSARRPGGELGKSCAGQSAADGERAERVFRSLILPRVREAVNTAPEYAALRRVYLSRVAAEWYRRRSRTGPTTYASLVDKGDVRPWRSRQEWSPRQVFDAYVRSYKRGEFKVTRDRGGLRYSYFYGGVDFSRLTVRQAGESGLRARWDSLPGTAAAGAGRTAAGAGKTRWLTGSAPSADRSPRARMLSRVAGALALLAKGLLVLLAALVVAGVVALLVLRRRRVPPPPPPPRW
ncbi:hypothetical protein ACI2LC_19305 [Nonomuraea wenchangensis]|uniref:hypothetical protein n=1 Tax=Nonomuraea wenchangensis TaxID=568860 RepID=UPI00384FC158